MPLSSDLSPTTWAVSKRDPLIDVTVEGKEWAGPMLVIELVSSCISITEVNLLADRKYAVLF